MKRNLIYLFLLVTLSAGFVQAQSVVITGKKVTYHRRKPISEYKKTFTINYPKVKAATSALSKKIEAALDYQKVLGLKLKEEMSEFQWIEEADFEVGYNNNGILSITLSMDGTAAYPSGTSKTVVIDLKTGQRLMAADVFTSIPGLSEKVIKAQKKEIADAIAEIKKDPENEEPNPEALFQDSKFDAKDLEGFSVSEKGVTFNYDYAFPHVIQALQPDGNFFFSWIQLKPFIKYNGAFARLAR
jgi:hypothetical protein